MDGSSASSRPAPPPLDDPRVTGALFDLSPNPYVVLLPELTIVGANQAYLKATRSSLEQIVGRGIFDAFPSSDENQRLVRDSLIRARESRAADHVAVVRYDMPRPDGTGFDELYWSATHVPILDDAGEVALILQHTVDITELHQLRRAATAPGAPSGALERLSAGVFRRAAEMQKTMDEVDGERRRIQELFRQAPGFICVLSGPEHVFEFMNHAYEQLVGHRDIVGKTVREALPDVAGQGFFELLDRVYRTGEPFVGRNMGIQIQRTPGAPPEQVYVDLLYQPIVEADGSISGIFVEGADVTEHRASERALRESEGRLRLMLDELNHRVKNTIATVQSIAAQTGRSAASVDDFVQAFNARLIALSHTHNALTRGAWAGADLRQIVEPELKPYGFARVAIEGEPVELPPRAAVTLGMCFHELATNAAKYGALSRPEGRVEVSWSVETMDAVRRLSIHWRETGGPDVSPPTRRGFGSKLIERSVTGELHGAAHLDFHPEGLRCLIEFALDPRS